VFGAGEVMAADSYFSFNGAAGFAILTIKLEVRSRLTGST